MEMETANTAMRKVWMNISKGVGGELTINRDYLYYLFREVERTNYEQGYEDGYDDRSRWINSEHPICNNFEDFRDKKIKW